MMNTVLPGDFSDGQITLRRKRDRRRNPAPDPAPGARDDTRANAGAGRSGGTASRTSNGGEAGAGVEQRADHEDERPLR